MSHIVNTIIETLSVCQQKAKLPSTIMDQLKEFDDKLMGMHGLSDTDVIEILIAEIKTIVQSLTIKREMTSFGILYLINRLKQTLIQAKLMALAPFIDSKDEEIFVIFSKACEKIVDRKFSDTAMLINDIVEKLSANAQKNNDVAQFNLIYKLRYVFVQDNSYIEHLRSQALPESLLAKVFGFLSKTEANEARLVCKQWGNLITPKNDINVFMFGFYMAGVSCVIDRLAFNRFNNDMPLTSNDNIVVKSTRTKNYMLHDFYRHSHTNAVDEPEINSMINILSQKKVHVVVLCCAESNFSYFVEKHLPSIQKTIDDYCHLHNHATIPILMVGTQSDKLPLDSNGQPHSYINLYSKDIMTIDKILGKGNFIECSAKTGHGMTALFKRIYELSKPESYLIQEKKSGYGYKQEQDPIDSEKKCIVM